MDSRKDDMESMILKAAHAGFSNSQVSYGTKCLIEGNYGDAYGWFSRAIIQRHPIATFMLAWMHLHGFGCKQNIKLACEGYKSLTELGQGPNLAVAYFPLYICYRKLGDILNSNDILVRGLKNGSAECIRVLGCHEFKKGNFESSYDLLKKAGELGDSYSAYHAGTFPGKEIDIKLVRISSLSYWKGGETMGTFIMKGKILGSWQEAFEYYRTAYNISDPSNQHRKWLEILIWWMEKSFGRGEFGFLHISDDHPIENAWRCMDQKEFTEAIKFFTDSLEEGDFIGDCSLNLGFLHLFGMGVEKDLYNAHEYISRSLEHYPKDEDQKRFMLDVIHEIRKLMEENPDYWKILLDVYTIENNFDKIEHLKEIIKSKNV